jgi:hypothetical protein
MKNNKDITSCIIEFYVNFLKSYLNFINIKEEFQIKLLKFFYTKILKDLFINSLIKFYNNENLKEEIKNLKKTDYKSLANFIYEKNSKNDMKIKTFGIMELLLLKEIGKANNNQLNIFYDELNKCKEITELFTLEHFFIKIALNIVIYNLYYNKKFDVDEGKIIIDKFIKLFSKKNYKNVGIDFNTSKIRILLEPYIEEFGNSLVKSLSKS